MPRLAPFHAIRFGPHAGDAGTLLAPPYDVIDTAGAEGLRNLSPYNAVRLILPEGRGEERYAWAAQRLSKWLAAGILMEDTEPALYVYRQSFRTEGHEGHRLGLLCSLHLSAFSEGDVLPHEETHSGPKEDRLALTLACRAQLSSVFLLASDTDGGLLKLLERACEVGENVLSASTPDGQHHRLHRLCADDLASDLCRRAGSEPLLIADGHHRYETALEARRQLPEAPRAQRVLVCVVSEADPGLLILPTHRSLSVQEPAGSWLKRLEGNFFVEPLSTSQWPAPCPDAGDDASMVLRDPATETAWSLKPRPEALSRAGIGDEERRVASVLFDRLVLREILSCSAGEAARQGILSYHRKPQAATEAAGPGGAAFLLPPIQVREVRRLAHQGRRVPPKTTYFAPKVPSGLVLRRV